MDLINSAVAMKQSGLMSQVQMSVARKILDHQEMQGAAAIQLIEAASKIGSGDAMVAAATGLGGQLDTYG